MTASTAPTTVNIFEMMDRARAREDVISMGLGDPDLATPKHIVAAAKVAIAEGRTGAAPARGLPELRRAIARKLVAENGVQADPETEV
ncbi:MAG: aromatic amino acid aminotransferase, partial [Thermomicrobiales bacterium]|nr:aromatic amino acid aminotransferase [Thermomicrobiales bacterium]